MSPIAHFDKEKKGNKMDFIFKENSYWPLYVFIPLYVGSITI